MTNKKSALEQLRDVKDFEMGGRIAATQLNFIKNSILELADRLERIEAEPYHVSRGKMFILHQENENLKDQLAQSNGAKSNTIELPNDTFDTLLEAIMVGATIEQLTDNSLKIGSTIFTRAKSNTIELHEHEWLPRTGYFHKCKICSLVISDTEVSILNREINK